MSGTQGTKAAEREAAREDKRKRGGGGADEEEMVLSRIVEALNSMTGLAPLELLL